MRMTRIGMLLLIGGLVLPGVALAQSPADEEQGTSAQGLAESPDDVGPSRNYRAPGLHLWMGRIPSREEFNTALAQARAQAKSRTSSISDAPNYQNELVKIYIGKLPKPGSR